MPVVHAYSPEEIENMRSAIMGLYMYGDELHKTMSVHETSSLVEQMVQTYIAAGITGEQLQQLYYDKLMTDDKKEKAKSAD